MQDPMEAYEHQETLAEPYFLSPNMKVLKSRGALLPCEARHVWVVARRIPLREVLLLTDWFLVGNGGMGYWDYYRGP